MDIVHAQNYFVFMFTNLILIEEKMHVSVTICIDSFPDYAFNENIHNMYRFHGWDVFLIQIFYDRHKK